MPPLMLAMGIAALHPSYELRPINVIASEAKQSIAQRRDRWIASLRSQ
jgi:hypothetical protein